MNIREAILAAADHIERNPGEFQFYAIGTPSHPGCGTPGCAMGWIGAFAGTSGKFTSAADLLGLTPQGHRRNPHLHPRQGVDLAFYGRMEDASGLSFPESTNWQYDPIECARVLRRYADRYHPATEPAYPNWQAIATGPKKVRDSARDQALDWVRA